MQKAVASEALPRYAPIIDHVAGTETAHQVSCLWLIVIYIALFTALTSVIIISRMNHYTYLSQTTEAWGARENIAPFHHKLRWVLHIHHMHTEEWINKIKHVTINNEYSSHCTEEWIIFTLHRKNEWCRSTQNKLSQFHTYSKINNILFR